MILASDLVTDLEFLIDDENSDRYSFANDYQPAINSAVRYIMSAFDKAFERGSLSPTVFGELLFGEKITPAAISGLDASKLIVTVTSMWRLVGIDPAPIFETADYIGPTRSIATQLSFDMAGNAEEDPFEAGATQPTDLAQYSYTSMNIVDPGGTPIRHLILRPAAAGDVAVVYLRVPTKVIATDTQFEFPYALYQPVLMKAYQYMLFQGGKQPLQNMQVSDKEVQELVALFR